MPTNQTGQHSQTFLKEQQFTSKAGTWTDDLIIVKAKITMKTTEEGGRQSGFISGYRPNHVFEMPENLKNLRTYIGDIQFDDQDLIEPGETL